MDGRQVGTHSTWRLLTATIALVLVTTLGAPFASAASPRSCRVQNTDSGRTYTALQAAVDAAKSGAHLIVRGTCHGTTTFDKNLLVEGRRTKRSGRPSLDGDDRARPLVVTRGSTRVPHVTIRGLTIRNGRARPSLVVDGFGGEVGGAIWSDGDLRLVDVVVRDSRARAAGGGIYTQWADLRLNGTTRVEGNASDLGGGIFCWYGQVTLNGSSSIADNMAREGGGVASWGGLYLNDASSIAGNHARTIGGGGYLINTTLHLSDAASIRDNSSDRSGAGIYFDAYIDEENWDPSEMTMGGSSSITGNRAGSADSTQGCDRRPSRAGGLWAGPALVLTMTGTSVISGNDATCGGGGLYSKIRTQAGGALSGVSCAPQTLANVYGNMPDDCSFE